MKIIFDKTKEAQKQWEISSLLANHFVGKNYYLK
jgi:hypothetical protein